MTKAHEIAMERQKAHAWLDDNIVEVMKVLKTQVKKAVKP